jgi:hypothetical protein
MNAPIEDLGTYLIANIPSGTPLVAGTNLFYGQIPESAGLSVCLIDGAGTAPQIATEVNDIDQPGVQIMVRGTLGGYQAAYSLIAEVVDTLHKTATTINSTTYIIVSKMNEPACIGYDSTNRPVFTCHMAIKRRS